MLRSLINDNSGLTLIEIMVSMMIVSVAFAGLMQAFPIGLAISRDSENASLASFVAQAEIEDLRSLDYDDITVGTLESNVQLSTDPNDYLYNYRRTTVVNYVDTNLNNVASDFDLKKISVTVNYPDSLFKSGTKSFIITSLISNR